MDGISFAGVSLLFPAIAGLAAYPPARRAMRVDPMVARAASAMRSRRNCVRQMPGPAF